MKYSIKLDDVTLTNDLIKSVEINVSQQIKDSYALDKNRVEVNIEGELFTKDNDKIKNNKLVKNLLKIKDKYFDVNINIDDTEYKFPKLYIYKLIQKFNREVGKFNIVLMQKFLGDEKELEVDIHEN